MQEKIGKKYNLFTTICLAFGIVIGVGVYFKTGEIATLTQGNLGIGLAAWCFAGFMTILSGLTYAEYASITNESGGDLTYLRMSMGDVPAFMLGWGKVLLGEPSLVVVLGWVSSSYIMQMFNWTGNGLHVLLTFLLIVILFAVNLFKPSWGAKGQSIMTVIKLVPIAVIVILGLFFSPDPQLGHELAKPITLPEGTSVVRVFFATLIPVVFAYSGWAFAATVSGEVENAKKNLPRAIIISLAAVTAVYVLIYLAFANTLPADQLAQGVPFQVVEMLLGDVGGKALMVFIVISALGAMNGIIIGSMRTVYSLSIKKLFVASDYFGEINQKFDMPLRGVFVTFMMACVHLTLFAFMGMAGDFSGICVVVNLLMYCLIYVGLIFYRKKNGFAEDTFRTFAFPLVPVLATICTLTLCVGLFLIDASTTRNVLIAFVFYGLGLPVYYLTRRASKK